MVKTRRFLQKVDISGIFHSFNSSCTLFFQCLTSLLEEMQECKKDMMERLRFVATLLKNGLLFTKINKISNNDTNLDLKDSEEIDLNSQMTIKTLI